MVFTSQSFLFVFLPAFLAIYGFAPPAWRIRLLLAGSLIFYAGWKIAFVPVLLCVIAVAWISARGAEMWRGTRLGLYAAISGAGALVALLAAFKYGHAGVEGLATVFAPAATNAPSWITTAAMPVGLSFFVFHAVSYIADVWRGDARAERNPLRVATFIAMFPHLVAGPVLKAKDLIPQMTGRAAAGAAFTEGCLRFMAGFSKKVLIADPAGLLADAAFALSDPSAADAWLGLLAYAVQIYFDFSGYSDMALGLALMLGFRFPENFNAPYAGRSLREFWRRWHISLSSWLRDYVYIPLGGSRKGRVRTAIHLILTFFLAGIWHGAGWTFALWGLWHGLLLAAERLTGFGPKGLWGRVYTLSAVGLGWVLFRAADAPAALSFWTAMAGVNGFGISDVFGLQIRGLSIVALLCGLGLIAAEPRMLKAWRRPVSLPGGGTASESLPPPGAQAATVALFALALTRLLAMGETPFLYGRF